jgi:hydroxypyruvate isomerase
MPRFSANLTMLYTEVDFMDRFALAADSGFKAVEYMFPYPHKPDDLKAQLDKFNLTQVLFNLPAGDWGAGERGIALLPNRKAEFRKGVIEAIRYAEYLGCSRINCLVGLITEDVVPEAARETLVENLSFAAGVLEDKGIRLLVEALNTYDIPHFFLSSTTDAVSLLAEVNHPNLFIQYDVYHMQVMEGNLTATIRSNVDRIAHIQIADNPGRHEPGTGEINFTNLFRFIDETGYDGYIGCEYKPLATTEKSLGWMKAYL